MMKYDGLVKQALEMLADGELFVEMCEELDSWNGFLGDERVYSMYDFDDLCSGCKPLEVLESIDLNDFNCYHDYFYYSIWGIRSLSSEFDVVEHYKDGFDAGEVLDSVIDNYSNIYFSDSDFKAVIEAIIEAREETDF